MTIRKIKTESSDHSIIGFIADISASVSETISQDSPMREDPIMRIPFAIIDEIADDSPAAEDGLQLSDEIVKFGNVEMGDNLQSRLMAEAQSNQGNPVPLVIVRQGSVMNLTVTPRPWHGRGILGYFFSSIFPILHVKCFELCSYHLIDICTRLFFSKFVNFHIA